MEIGKEVYDTRGRQRNVFRLAHFDNEGLAHIVTYRILAFLSIVTGALTLITLHYGSLNGLSYVTYALIAIVWALFGIEIYATYKAFVVIATKGIVFGRLNDSFLNSEVKDRNRHSFLKPVGYAVLAIWYALLAVFIWVVFL